MGARKVHSLVDKLYKRKNVELAWEKVRQNKILHDLNSEESEKLLSKTREIIEWAVRNIST
jgi:hypothetical protein